MTRSSARRSDPESLRVAIDDLEALLKAGLGAAEAVAQAAHDNDCSQVLLGRAFQIKHQRSPNDWRPPASQSAMARRVAAAAARRYARDAKEFDPLYGHARRPQARFLLEPGTIITMDKTEIAVCYLLDRSAERPHARISGVPVETQALPRIVNMQGERETIVSLLLLSGKLALPGLDGLGIHELQAECIARTVKDEAGSEA